MTADDGHDGVQYLAGSPSGSRCSERFGANRGVRRVSRLRSTRRGRRSSASSPGSASGDWVVKRGAAYHVTPTGKRVHDAYEELLDEVELADRYGQFAADLERVGADFPPSALDTGELTVAADRNPPPPSTDSPNCYARGAARKSAPSRPSSSSSSTMPRQRRSTRALRSNSLSTATWSRNRSRSSARRPIGRSTTTARRCTSPRTDRIRGLPVRRSRVRDRLRQQKQPPMRA